MGFGLEGEVLLIPKPKLTPRSIPTPRFQPMSSYPLYSSLMLHCSQAPISIAIAPCPAKISASHQFSAEAPLIIHRPSIVSTDGNGVATIDHLGLYTLATGSQPYQKDRSLSPVPIYFLSPLFTHPCFNTPDPHHPCLPDPRSHDPSGSDYYSSIISLV